MNGFGRCTNEDAVCLKLPALSPSVPIHPSVCSCRLFFFCLLLVCAAMFPLRNCFAATAWILFTLAFRCVDRAWLMRSFNCLRGCDWRWLAYHLRICKCYNELTVLLGRAWSEI